ncbi:YtxC-like family [Acididesulfobacillus acetoxydans]|uniref:YtxC-like family n=1 Tax=Acididesulfobacillus acetoxydans TaxID=1561005 RepID=A0A8S0WLC5_9FIRM|nr:putative sporulation protein YtxC [Acididesulfobacillus acetoxydans]CAA7599954.1 YtxC-like family [Acididesulfobacillus acetoxydans]CEJ07954.1 YtxC-like protein [Acididesulfobacillus acetoxydans]
MEYSVQLGTQHYKDNIYEHLLELRKREQLPFEISETRFGERWLIRCSFQLPSGEAEEKQTMVRKIQGYYLANALAETILEHWEEKYVLTLLGKKYRLKKAECSHVLPRTLRSLNEGKSYPGYKTQRKTKLVAQILAVLEKTPTFDVEGFLRFRAQEYKTEVDRTVAQTVDEYILEREYYEFVKLLKYFLDSQSPRVDTLHVGISASGKFHLFNDQGEKVTGLYLDGFSADESGQELSYEDLLISALISAAPRQVVLHIRFPGYRDTLHTIRDVFEDKVQDCPGCTLCGILADS